MTPARALIVIPCLNEEAHLPGLLDQLVREIGHSHHRVIVADGGSTDASREIVRAQAAVHDMIELMENPARLQAAGVNAAVRRRGADYAYLIRMDAHARYPSGFVEGLLAVARREQADSVVVPMNTVGETCFQTAAAVAQNSAIGTGGAAHRAGGSSGWVDHGHHALMRIDRFTAVGGYDERFSHNEDAELDLRLAGSGARIWMETSLTLDYFPRRAAGPLFRQYVNYGRGRARTVRLHGVQLKLRQALPLAVLPAVIAACAAVPLALLHPVMLIGALPCALWMLACLTGGAMAARRAGDPCGYGAGPVAMVMHLGWSAGFWREWLTGRRLPPRPSADLSLDPRSAGTTGPESAATPAR